MADTDQTVEKTEVELPNTTADEGEDANTAAAEGAQTEAAAAESSDVVVEVAADDKKEADAIEEKVEEKVVVSEEQALEDEQWELIRSLIGEFVATWLFLFITITTVIYSTKDDDAVGGKMTTGRHLTVALTFGISITVLVYQFATVSGANINPAVTFALMVTNRMEKVKGFLYIVAQVCGAIVGTLCVYGLDPTTYKNAGGGCNGIPSSSQISNNVGAAFGVEFFGTMLLVLTVLAAIDPDNAKAAVHIGSLAPLTIGLAVFLAHCLAIPVTGTGINPARSFGPAIVNGCWDGHWVFWVSPLLSAAISGLFYDIILSPDRTAAMKRLKNE